MSRPWLLVVSGPPCSGKSVLARRLAQDTGWPICAKDAFKEILFETLGSGDADWSRRLSLAAFELQLAAAGIVVQAGASVLVEGNFRAAEHAGRLLDLPARLVQVACVADHALLEARHRARAAGGARHPGHLDAATRWSAATVARHAPLPVEPTFTYDSSPGREREYPDLLARLAALGVPAGRPRGS